MSFSKFTENILCQKQIIKQGGNAFTNVTPIKKEYIQSTIEKFIKQILVPTYKIFPDSNIIFPLGSTGKKEQSGDIDLAINVLLLPQKRISKVLKTIYSYTKFHTDINVIINPISNDMLQFAYPVKETGQFVQIDLLLTNKPTFTKWYMFSPDPRKTKYKAAHRNQLLRAIPKTLTLNQLEYKDNQLVAWTQQDINYTGVYYQTQTLIDTNGNRLKYKDTQLLLPEYAKIKDQELITSSPIKTYQRYISSEISPYSVQTFEDLLNILYSKQFKFKEDLDDILYTAAKMFKNNSKLEFPSQLEKYLN